MKTPTLPTLYLDSKTGDQDPAVRFLDDVGVGYHKVLVARGKRTDTGQPVPQAIRKESLPVFEWNEADSISHFDLPELVEFLHDHGQEFEDS